MTGSPLVDSCFVFPVFSPGDDLIACLNKAMAFLTAISSLRVTVQQVQERQGQSYSGTAWYKDKEMLAEAQEAGQILDEEQLTEDLDTYDSDCDNISNAKAVLMANISSYSSDVILEPVIDDEETLILEDVSRPKMAKSDKDPEAVKRKIYNKPIDYVKLNKIYEDFRKCFVPQQELSAGKALWYHMVNPSTKSSDALPVKIEAPKKHPKVSLVNKNLKKLKLHLADFDKVVKIKTTPNARTECEWGFEHTNAVFNNEIIPYLNFLKDIFNVFDRDLLNEIMEVQTVFDQMDAAVQRSLVDKQCLENAKKDLFLENDQRLHQIMSQDIRITVMNSMSLIDESVNVERKRNESCDKCFNFKAELLKSQNAHNDLLKRSQLQDKDTTICKFKDIIKSMRENSKDENVNYDYVEIETKNVELENSMEKLISEDECLCKETNHVKHVYKEQFDSIKKTRVCTKEQSDSLIDKLNLKSGKNEDLKAQIQDKVFVITSLKNDLRRIKGKEIVDIAAQKPSANTIVPGMFKLDLETLAPRLLQNRLIHLEYLKNTQEQADILRGIVEQAKAKQPLNNALDFA
nr:hypothetical protein [Tanacetum cinerariifolium]